MPGRSGVWREVLISFISIAGSYLFFGVILGLVQGPLYALMAATIIGLPTALSNFQRWFYRDVEKHPFSYKNMISYPGYISISFFMLLAVFGVPFVESAFMAYTVLVQIPFFVRRSDLNRTDPDPEACVSRFIISSGRASFRKDGREDCSLLSGPMIRLKILRRKAFSAMFEAKASKFGYILTRFAAIGALAYFTLTCLPWDLWSRRL